MNVESTQRLTGWELVDPYGPGDRAPVHTAEQEHAIGRRGEPLLLAAGAGSGKTAVLVERFVRAVSDDGIAPDRILAITFTERAAGELRTRVRSRLRSLGEATAAEAVQRAYVGTFHGFCARLLRAHARAAGIDEGFEILDEGLSGRLRRQAFAQALGELVTDGRGQMVDLIAAYTADRARATVLGVYAELRSHGQRMPVLPVAELDEVAATGQQELSSEDDRRAQRALNEKGIDALVLWAELLRTFGEHYEAAKRTRAGLDFDDLELIAGELLRDDERLRLEWASRFELLMVDELQDVNPRQLALLGALERGNLFTVGDEWQSIYGFRHADVSLFRARRRRLAPRGQSLLLTRNFRGRAELLETVNAVFAKRFGGSFTPLCAGREPAREHDRPTGPRVELLLSDRRAKAAVEIGAGMESGRDIGADVDMKRDASARSGAETALRNGRSMGTGGAVAEWREAEAQALAARVSELVHGGWARAGDVAVLLRGIADIDCYEQALRGHGLETVASAGAFWTRQEVVDLLVCLRALVDPADEVALYGVLAAPPVELSSDGLALLARAARERGESLWDIARAGIVGGERVAAHCAWLERQRARAAETALAELLEHAIAHGDLAARLRGKGDGARRLANVSKLVELAADWERSEGRDLRGFLEEAAFQQGAGGRLANAEASSEPDAPVMGESNDAVALMSVHAAKGLEFDVVCVADLGRVPNAAMPDLLVKGERVGVRLVELDDLEPRPALRYAELARERRQAQAEEEDRIVYVAMTRARERLLLSGSCDFTSWPRDRPGAAPIAWLGPALSAELPSLCAEAARAPDDAAARELTVDGTDVPLRCLLTTARRP